MKTSSAVLDVTRRDGKASRWNSQPSCCERAENEKREPKTRRLYNAANLPTAAELYNSLCLTACSRVLPDRLTGPQLVKTFPAFYGTRHLSLS